jgi:hypothetical protein
VYASKDVPDMIVKSGWESLPRWLRVGDAIDFVDGVHPRFDRSKAERYLKNTNSRPS